MSGPAIRPATVVTAPDHIKRGGDTERRRSPLGMSDCVQRRGDTEGRRGLLGMSDCVERRGDTERMRKVGTA